MDKLYERLLRFTGEGILRYRLEDGVVLLANEGLVKLLGLDCAPDQLIGRPLRELLVYTMAEGTIRKALAQRGEIHDFEYHFRTLKGEDRWVLHDSFVTTDPDTGATVIEAIVKDITHRKLSEQHLKRLNRELRTISECNQVLVRAGDEAELMREVCRVIVEAGGYRMAWIGLAEPEEPRAIRPVACAGHEEGYLAGLDITWGDDERGRGPAGTAIRGGSPCVCGDLRVDGIMTPWRQAALQRGYLSLASLPLISEHRPVGCLNIYSERAHDFPPDETRLLAELASDTAYGIAALRERVARRRVEESARGERDFISAVLDVAGALVVVLDGQGRIVRFNRACEQTTGWSFGEARGRRFWEFLLLPEEVQPVRSVFEQLRAGSFPSHFENCWVTRDGRRRLIAWSNTALVDDHGQVEHVIGTGIDVTERRAAEEQTVRQNAILLGINELLQQALVCQSVEEVAAKCLAVAEQLTGSRFGFMCEVNDAGRFDTLAISDPGWDACRIPKTNAVLKLNDLEIRGIRGRVIREQRSLIFNQPQADADWISPPPGHPPITCFLGVPLKQSGKTIGQIGLGNKPGGYTPQDVDAVEALAFAFVEALMRKRAEMELQKHRNDLEGLVHQRTAELRKAQGQMVQSEKMAALGQLVAGVAHEINNPLSFVSNNLMVLQRDVGALCHILELYRQSESAAERRDDLRRDLAEMSDRIDLVYTLDNLPDLLQRSRDGLRRIQQIVTDLRSFAAPDTGLAQDADLNAGIRSTVNIVMGQAKGKQVALEMELDESLPPVACNPVKINQAVMNLLTNAIDACDRGGRVVIRSGVLPRGGGKREVRIEVSDTGHGVPPELRDRIFEPFFTTKPQGLGLGLGLSITYGIVHDHGGRIDLDSAVGQGSKFTIVLPLAK